MDLKFETSQTPVESMDKSKAPEAAVRLTCMHNSMVFNKTEFLCCEHEGRPFRYSSNNQLERSSDPLLAAELAVFSGNLLKFILGEPQPDYYLAKNKEKGKYYRISNELESYEDWVRVIRIDSKGEIFFNWPESVEKPILSVKIRQLTAIMVACHFLGEIDWADDNFGFVNIGDEFIAVRLDPGCSFHSSVFENTYTNLADRLENLLISYISEEINEDQEDSWHYLSSLIDHENKKLKAPVAKLLFSNRTELITTLCRIAELTREDLEMIAKKSFSKEHWSYAEDYINQLLNRQESYQEALNTLSKAKKQKHDDMASDVVTPLKYFEPPRDNSTPSTGLYLMQNFSLERKRKRFNLPESITEEPDTLYLKDNGESFQHGHAAILQQSQLQIEEEETTDLSPEENHRGTIHRLGFFSTNEAQTIKEEEKDELRKVTRSEFRTDS